MNCPDCGAPAAGDEHFCRQCGASLEIEAAPADAPAGDLILEISAGPGAGRTFPLAEINRIGRGADNEIRLFDPEVSRSHAAIYRYDEGYAINDLGSVNGTFVNGNRIHEAAWILPGDRIQMGAVLFHVTLPGAPAFRSPDRSRPMYPPSSASMARPVTHGLPVVVLAGLMLLGILLAAGGVLGLIILLAG